MKRRTTVLAGMAALALVYGCGGGSGLNGFGPPDESLPAPVGPGLPAGSAMRLWKAGDQWDYKVLGTLVQVRDGVTEAGSGQVKGTYRRQITSTTFQGQPVLKLTETWVVGPIGGSQTPSVSATYFKQLPNRDLQIVGKAEHDFEFATTTSNVTFPGAFANGTSRTGSIRFDTLAGADLANSTENMTLTVGALGSVGARSGAAWGIWPVSNSDTNTTNYTGVTQRIDLGDFIEEGTVLKRSNQLSRTENWNATLGSFVTAKVTRTLNWDEVKDPQVDAATGKVTFKKSVVKADYDLALALDSYTLAN